MEGVARRGAVGVTHRGATMGERETQDLHQVRRRLLRRRRLGNMTPDEAQALSHVECAINALQQPQVRAERKLWEERLRDTSTLGKDGAR